MEVGLSPVDFVLDGDPALPLSPAKVAQKPPLFLAHVYCGHGRPSQLLLSSCNKNVVVTASCISVSLFGTFCTKNVFFVD